MFLLEIFWQSYDETKALSLNFMSHNIKPHDFIYNFTTNFIPMLDTDLMYLERVSK